MSAGYSQVRVIAAVQPYDRKQRYTISIPVPSRKPRRSVRDGCARALLPPGDAMLTIAPKKGLRRIQLTASVPRCSIRCAAPLQTHA
jgi:hypothetical protein